MLPNESWLHFIENKLNVKLTKLISFLRAKPQKEGFTHITIAVIGDKYVASGLHMNVNPISLIC